MLAPNGRILLKFDLEQKDTVVYGTLRLYVPNRGDLNENMREAHPNLATVVDGGETGLKKDEVIILDHTCLTNKTQWIEEDNGIVLISLPITKEETTIYGKIGTNGEVIPLFGNLVCQRIGEKPISSIIFTPEAYQKVEKNKAIVLATDTKSDIHEGQTIIYYNCSDYELVYFIDGKERRTVMVKREDVVGIEK